LIARSSGDALVVFTAISHCHAYVEVDPQRRNATGADFQARAEQVPDCLDVGAALFRTRLEQFGPHIPAGVVAGIADNVLIPMLRPAPKTSNDR
jgi:hypothetical protein